MSKISYTMLVSFCGNTFLSIFKVITGIIFKCSSLLADGIHTFSDLSTDLMIIINDKDSNDSKRVYIISLILGFLIIALGLGMIYFSMKKDISVPSTYAILVSFLTIIFKYLLSNYLYKKGKKYNNQTLTISAKESNLDVISSVVVLIAITLSILFKTNGILKYSDSIGCILVSLFVILSGFDIISINIQNIFGVSEHDEEYLNRIKSVITSDNDIKKLVDLDLTKYNNCYYVNCSLVLDSNMTLYNANKISSKLKTRLRNYDKRIDDITVHVKLDTKE